MGTETKAERSSINSIDFHVPQRLLDAIAAYVAERHARDARDAHDAHDAQLRADASAGHPASRRGEGP